MCRCLPGILSAAMDDYERDKLQNSNSTEPPHAFEWLLNSSGTALSRNDDGTLDLGGWSDGTWIGGSGDWNTATNSSGGVLPGTNDDVVINTANTSITVTHSSGTHTVKSLTNQDAFQLTGGSLTVSNTVEVNNTFTLAGGTLVSAIVLQDSIGCSLQVTANSVLDGVVLNANTLIESGSQGCGSLVLTVLDGLALNGTLMLKRVNGYYFSAVLGFGGTQTLGRTGQVVFCRSGWE